MTCTVALHFHNMCVRADMCVHAGFGKSTKKSGLAANVKADLQLRYIKKISDYINNMVKVCFPIYEKSKEWVEKHLFKCAEEYSPVHEFPDGASLQVCASTCLSPRVLSCMLHACVALYANRASCESCHPSRPPPPPSCAGATRRGKRRGQGGAHAAPSAQDGGPG